MQTQVEVGRAVVYVRVSSWKQTQTTNVSMTVQEKDCVALINRLDGSLKEVQRDEGKSGLDIYRPAYLRVLDLVQSGEVDTVVIYAVDRLGRDQAEFHRIAKMFRLLGVNLLSATQDISDPLIAGIYASQAEQYAWNLGKKVRDAQAEKMADGRSIGRPPFGYSSQTHPDGRGMQLVKDPDNYWKVEKVFALYATGTVGLTGLAAYARTLGWNVSRSALSRILTNPTYVGKLVFGRNVKRVTLDGHSGLHRAAKVAWKVWDGDHAAIVDQDTFDAVQAILAKNQTAKAPQPKERQMLIGMIYCKCGGRMQGVVNRSGRYRCYFCPKRREKTSNCDQGYVAVGKINAQVKGDVRAVVERFTGAGRAVALADLEATKDQYLDDAQVQRRTLEGAKARLETMISNAYDALLMGDLTREQLKDAERRAQVQLKSVNDELVALGEVAAVPNFAALVGLNDLVDGDWDSLDEAEWRLVMEAFVLRVDVNGEDAATTLQPEIEKVRQPAAAVAVLV